MKNYLLLLALAWMPFTTHGDIFQRMFKPEETPIDLNIDQVKKLNLSGSGKVIINFIPPTESPSVEVFLQKDGKSEKITENKELYKLISTRRTFWGTIFINLKKDEKNQCIVRINTHLLNKLWVNGRKLTVTIQGNPTLATRSELKLEASGKSAINIYNLEVKKLWIVSRESSHVTCDGISVKDLELDIFDSAEFTGNGLKVDNKANFYITHNSQAHIKKLATPELILRGLAFSKISLEGKVIRGTIGLVGESELHAPQLHIKEGRVCMHDTAQAHLSIEDIEEQDIKDEAQFKNEA